MEEMFLAYKYKLILVREMVLAELKQFNYQEKINNFNQVNNDLLLEKIRNMINDLKSYRDGHMKKKYENR